MCTNDRGLRHADLLRLQQLFDTQFPVGAFAHSGGLETYSHVAGFDAAALHDLLAGQLERGWGRLELAVAALAFDRGWDLAALDALAAEVQAWKPVPGQREASLKLGRRWAAIGRRLFPAEMDGFALRRPHQSVVVGALARRLDAPRAETILLYAQSTLSSSLAAATRSMSLSPEQAQETLIRLQPAVVIAAERAAANPEESFYAATPGLDVRAHQQAYLHTRLFQS